MLLSWYDRVGGSCRQIADSQYIARVAAVSPGCDREAAVVGGEQSSRLCEQLSGLWLDIKLPPLSIGRRQKVFDRQLTFFRSTTVTTFQLDRFSVGRIRDARDPML